MNLHSHDFATCCFLLEEDLEKLFEWTGKVGTSIPGGEWSMRSYFWPTPSFPSEEKEMFVKAQISLFGISTDLVFLKILMLTENKHDFFIPNFVISNFASSLHNWYSGSDIL